MLSAEEIKEKLGDRNLSEVARRTDVSYSALHYMVNGGGGTRPSQEMLQKLSEYLGEE